MNTYLNRRIIFILSLFIIISYSSCSQNTNRNHVYKLWTGGSVPKSEDIPVLKHVVFRTIKKYEPKVDGFRWLHGVAIARYHNEWVVSFGHNKGGENTGTGEAQSMFSKNVKDWGDTLITIANPNGDVAVSHGVLLNNNDTLWSFNASFHDFREGVHTNAYIWNGEKRKWEYQGDVAGEGFWPLQEPHKMDNGEWIMAGASVGKEAIPAVAICENDNFRHWKVIKVPTNVKIWGESSVIIDSAHIILIARSGTSSPKIKGYSYPLAWVSISNNYGHTWSELQPSNLPMAASKPYAGILSNGQRYLIGTTTANAKNHRHPLTIAVSKPGENTFCKVYCIRRAIHKKGNVESAPNAKLSYPYAIEYNDSLYVVYSNSGGRSATNNNSAELAIIPVKELSVK